MENETKTSHSKSDTKKRTTIGFIIGISLLAILSAVFIGLYIYSGVQAKSFATGLENVYKRSFNELTSSVNEIEIKLSKTIASGSNATRADLLTEIWKDANIASDDLSLIPYSENGLSQTVKFINQVGAYSYYLADKINAGDDLTDEELKMLDEVHDFLITLRFDLSTINQSITNGNYKILSNINIKKFENSEFFNNFSDLQNNTIDTPQLIYDGPFSENLSDKEVKGLPEEVYTQDETKAFAQSIFENEEIKSIKFTGKTESDFVTHNYEITFSNGDNCYVEITERGKLLVQLTRLSNNETGDIELNKCIENAESFAGMLGMNNIKGVWASESEDVVYVNLTPVLSNIVMYPDLIKVKVSKATGKILGYEAKAFIYNNVVRQDLTAEITISQAEAKLNKRLMVKNKRLAIIPKKYGKEVLAYEFECEYKDYTYYAYINAKTGEEEELFRVIETTEGKLLM